jgi:UDP:flavonoid glycosyltransferase YjiC (YdhE family)
LAPGGRADRARANRVPAAVTELVTGPSYRERAQALARKLQTEDGAARLIETIEATI